LEFLEISNYSLSDTVCALLFASLLQIRRLRLINVSNVSSHAFATLSSSLLELDISKLFVVYFKLTSIASTTADNTVVQVIADRCPFLEVFVTSSSSVTDEGLDYIVQKCTNLKTLKAPAATRNPAKYARN
jgi:hypothetical protein